MRITLYYEDSGFRRRSEELVFDPDTLQWDGWRGDCKYQKIPNTGLPPPFSSVFVKRWYGEPAPAHRLMMDIRGKELPGTPRVFGLGQEGTDWFYVTKMLPDEYILLSQLLNPPDAKIVTVNLMRRIVEATTYCFQAIGRYDHIYTDYCSHNLMVDRQTGDTKLIDLDSAWSYQQLRDRKGNSDHTFTPQYWYLWHNFLVLKYPGAVIPENLAVSVVLAVAGVWGHALGRLKKSPRDLQEVTAFLCDTYPDIHQPLWEAVDTSNKDAFRSYLGIDNQADNLFADWQDIFQELIYRRTIRWRDIDQAMRDLMAFYPVSAVVDKDKVNYLKIFTAYLKERWVSTRKEFGYGIGVIVAWMKSGVKRIQIHKGVKAPASTKTAGDDIDWAVVRRNLYDPLRIISLTRRLLS